MNKPLTQEVFKDAPEWVKSASVDSDGEAWGHEVDKSLLVPLPYSDRWVQNCYRHNYPHYIGNGYDTTDWKQSVIDKDTLEGFNV